MRLISVVIPCYQSEHTIEQVVLELEHTLAKREEMDWEIILVSDASPDNVYDVIKKLARKNPKIKGINFSKNFGQHAAILAGFRAAKGEVVVTLDDDGQTPASAIYDLIDKLDEGYDVVFARYDEKKHSPFRNWGSNVNLYMMETLIGKPKGLVANSYMALQRFLVEEIIRYQNAFPYIAGLIFRSSIHATDVLVDHKARSQGQSGYTLGKLLKLWLNGFTAFSVQPLRLGIYLGAISAFFGFVYGVYTIIDKFLHPLMPMGYASTMAVLLFMGGLILMILGLIGEYVGRIYICINQSPQYVIKDKVNLDDEGKM